MRKFAFRLQSVLNYRLALEEEAERAYLSARAERLEAEAVFDQIDRRRLELCKLAAPTLDERICIERIYEKLDGQEREQRAIVQVLEIEEEKLRQAWLEARRETEVLRKLREKAWETWREEANRIEQAELDEWAVLRRTA